MWIGKFGSSTCRYTSGRQRLVMNLNTKNDALADPADPKSIKAAIEAAWEEGKTSQKCINLKNRVIGIQLGKYSEQDNRHL